MEIQKLLVTATEEKKVDGGHGLGEQAGVL